MVGKATTGSSFSGLAAYLTQNEERVAWTEPRWMIGTDPKEVAREMEAAAAMATTRLEKPVYHVSISFSEADQPTREQMRTAADRVLHELGLGEHQALLVAHQDKGHPHLHVMVNRVHPDTGKVADVAFDYRRIETVLRGLEEEWGMTRVPGHHSRGASDEPPDRAQALSTGEIRHARRTGDDPFPEEIRKRMGDDLKKAIENAKSWDELREALGRYGYRIEPTARGMKITDGERYAKASGVDERLGRFRLEERFGERLTGKEADGRGVLSHTNHAELGARTREGIPGNGLAKENAASPRESVAGSAGRPPLDGVNGHSPAYSALFGKPALDRKEAPGSAGSGKLLGAAAAAARPVSGEDGEKEAPLRALEVGLRAAAALEGRLEAVRPALERSGADRSPAAAAGDPGTAGRGTVPVADPEVRQLARDIQVYERAARAEQGLSMAAGAYAEAELKWKAAERQGQEVARLSQTFDRALGEAYRDPAAARRAFETLAGQEGPGAAARVMRQEPERFGPVVEAVQRKWMGIATETSKAEGYAAARGAANVGEQYLHSRTALPSAMQSSEVKAVLTVKGAEMKAFQQELRRTGQPSALLEQIGRQARGLTSAQVYQLSRAISPEQMGVVMKAAGVSVRAMRGVER